MTKDVKINFDYLNDAPFSQSVVGKLTVQNLASYLEYVDSEGVRSVIGVSGDTVTITRMEEPCYTMILEENKTQQTFLHTSLGEIPITVHTVTAKHTSGIDYFILDLEYDVNFNGNPDPPIKHIAHIEAKDLNITC